MKSHSLFSSREPDNLFAIDIDIEFVVLVSSEKILPEYVYVVVSYSMCKPKINQLNIHMVLLKQNLQLSYHVCV